MVIGQLRTFAIGLLMAGWLSSPNVTNAAIPELAEPTQKQFQIVPAEGTHPGQGSRRLANPRPVVIIARSEGAAEEIRRAFLRAAFFGSLGIIGLIFIGWRTYGRRHGRVTR